jgi:polyisoprenyl-phosphate glycosyltransferase
MDISVVVPVHNEMPNIEALHEKLTNTFRALQVNFEIIFVNDGSTDGSLQLIKEISSKDKLVKFIDFSRNFGHQVAIMAGIDHASGDAIVIMDADLQDPPELIADMYKKLKQGYEVVYARRKTRKGKSYLKFFAAKLFYRVLARVTSVPIPVDTGDFRIITKKVAQVLRNMPEQDKFLRGQIAWIGFRQSYIEYEREQRIAGKTSYTYRMLFKLSLDGITSFSNLPLKFASMAGFIVSGIAFFIMLYALYSRYILKDYVEGSTSLILSVMFIGGIQLICIGIIGEYISRIISNIRQRPLYIINETNVK